MERFRAMMMARGFKTAAVTGQPSLDDAQRVEEAHGTAGAPAELLLLNPGVCSHSSCYLHSRYTAGR